MRGAALDLDAALRRFGHSEFRPGQREAIERLLEAGRMLLVAPTGGGKSLTYQLPASILPGTTLVVSPLIALMHDQVAALAHCGLRATYLASTLDPHEARERMQRLRAGEYDLVYVAPERLAREGFRARLGDLDCPLVAVDEAHCISEWGHDFRPEYLGIGAILETLPKARVLACTATATPVVRDEILSRLGLPPDTPQVLRGFARPNLSLRALQTGGRRERDAAVEAALAEALGSPGARVGAAILYSPTRRGSEEEAARLATRGWRTACYHAGLSPSDRDATQSAFIEGSLEVIVATNAFGMGIDRQDVRAVVHLGPPGSLEAWYQEVGRAGRDGQRALGLLLWSGADFPTRRHLIESSGVDACVAPEVTEHKWNLFLELMRWADGGGCRHDAVLRYFGDEAETLAGCGICDVCTRLSAEPADGMDPEATGLVVRKALSAVARIHGRYGLSSAVKLLRGVRDPRLERSGLTRVTTFGVLSDHSERWLSRVLWRCVTAGWVGFDGGLRPVAVLTAAGHDVMRGSRPAQIVLPESIAPQPAGAAPRRRTGLSASPESLDAAATERFESLRAWRLEAAREQQVPPYVVASDRTLRDVAQQQPRDREALLACHGIGPARADRYGEAILAVVRQALD